MIMLVNRIKNLERRTSTLVNNYQKLMEALVENMKKIASNVDMQVDNIMVLDLDEAIGTKETLGKKRTKFATKKLKTKTNEYIKEDIKATIEKITEKKEEMAPKLA